MQQQEKLWPGEVQTYEAFELYAGLVQSRAFHMLQENWITGSAQEGLLFSAPCVCQLCRTKRISSCLGAVLLDVFVQQAGAKCLCFTPGWHSGVELYMLPAVDMINHSTEPDKRNTLLRKSHAEMTVKVDGESVTFQGFFTMKAGPCCCSNPYKQPYVFCTCNMLCMCSCQHSLHQLLAAA